LTARRTANGVINVTIVNALVDINGGTDNAATDVYARLAASMAPPLIMLPALDASRPRQRR
jgi:hypothetical protein